MSELVRSIPGPLFLILLWGLSLLAFLIHARSVETAYSPEKGDDASLTALELGYLARGKRGVIETALVMAEQEHAVRIDSDTKRIHPIEGAKPRHNASKELLGELSESQGSIQSLSLKTTVESIRLSLVERGFLIRDARSLRIVFGLALYGPIVAIAVTKLQLGLSRGRPVVFLVLSLLILGVTMLLKTFGTTQEGKCTRKAKRILEQRKRLMQPILKNSLSMDHRPDAAPKLTALFGLEQMKKTGWNEHLPIIGLVLASAPLWMVEIPVYRDYLSGWSGNSTSSGGSDSGCGGGGSSGDSGCGGGGGGGCGGCGGD